MRNCQERIRGDDLSRVLEQVWKRREREAPSPFFNGEAQFEA